MNGEPKLLDVVALLRDIPEENVRRGMVGTIVETNGDLFLVEFSNNDGETIALPTLKSEDFLLLERITSQKVADL
jgi:hypothetical protein